MSESNALQAFQEQITNLLLRHRSILDTTSKFQESSARVNRAIMKAVTECGCIRIDASKQDYNVEGSLNELKDKMDTHIKGQICEHCEEIVIREMGKNLFYLLATMNQLNISVEEVIKKEQEKLNTLGIFNLS